jgi:hypothetical protein
VGVTDVDRTRTRSGRGGGTRRGQTLHDYVAGITVFVVTVALVLGLLPSVVAPLQADGDVSASQSLRTVDRIVDNLSLAGSPNTLEAGNLSALLSGDERDLIERFGLPEYTHVNVTLTSLDGDRTVANGSGVALTAGPTAADESTVSAARIVDVTGDGTVCSPACRLLVRVW